ncbi:MAG TPA: PadR family transcriptional regulator [Ornithinibacter sp.]|nr:PadR family transcriptional regulator [Ornithinibacter sp.]
MPRDRTTTSYAVLGLLAIRPWTTYELAKQVQRSLRWFWPRAERKLYDEPKRLADDGLATATREHTGKRGRTVYTITEAGRAALRDWLGEPFAPPTTEFEGMVKVFFSDAGSRPQLLATIERIEAQATERVDEIAGLAATRPPAFPEREHLSAIGLRLFREQEEATARWARWAREQVEQWPDTTDPGAWDAAAVLAEIATMSPRGATLSA